MKLPIKQIAIAASLMLAVTMAGAVSTQCLDKHYTLQLLGSGGPMLGDARASSGTLLWWNDKSSILIDAGGGVFLRFSQAGGKVEDLDFLGITHFHADHSSDLAALIKAGYFTSRKGSLALAGPSGKAPFPSLSEYFHALFNPKTGAYAYLSGVYDGSDGLFPVTLTDVDISKATPTKVFENANFTIWALGVPHGDVPALAYRIDSPRGRIVISGDQNGTNPAFLKFARGADVLVMPLAIDQEAASDLHAQPSTIGKIAETINPRMLILNHLMGRGLYQKNESIKVIKKYYHGAIFAGRDLACYPLPTQQENTHEKK